MDRFSFFNSASSAFFDDLYEQYLNDPDSVEPSWRSFFQGYDFQKHNYSDESLFIPEEISVVEKRESLSRYRISALILSLSIAKFIMGPTSIIFKKYTIY